jgi:hypothetical protein
LEKRLDYYNPHFVSLTFKTLFSIIHRKLNQKYPAQTIPTPYTPKNNPDEYRKKYKYYNKHNKYIEKGIYEENPWNEYLPPEAYDPIMCNPKKFGGNKMNVKLSKCGMDCGGCPWGPFVRKNMTGAEFGKFKTRAKKVLGYTPMKTPCLLCQTPDEKIPKGAKLPLRNCVVRHCVTQMGIENCAYCSRFPCEYLKEHATLWNRKNIEEKYGKPLSEENYNTFVKPFEALTRLQNVYATLKPQDIVEAVCIQPLKTKIVKFPEGLPFSKAEVTGFKKVHTLLSSIKKSSLGLKETDVYPQQQKLKNRIAHFIRFLWIFGRFGELTDKSITVNAKEYIDNRGTETGLAYWDFVEKVVFKNLVDFGVHCEYILEEKEGTTPTGYLRKKGWHITMSFDETIGGPPALKQLQYYAQALTKKYKKRAFSYFKKVDMRVLNVL